MTAGRRLLALLGSLLVMLLCAPSPQAWAVDDKVDSWTVAYTVSEAGVVHVTETLVYRFGTNSGRHGIDRYLLTREPWDDQHDAVYSYDRLTVTSPNASAAFTVTSTGSGREQFERIRIGSASSTISAATASYTLDYDITGAMRSSGDYDEFYWDAIGDLTPTTENIAITVDVPGGALDLTCYSGPAGSRQNCTSAVITGATATFSEASKAAGDILTVGVKITPGLISDNQPHLVDRADLAERRQARLTLWVSLATAVLCVGLGGWFVASRRRDQRFVGVAPGSIPPDPGSAPVALSGRATIPVSFNPPPIPLAAAGYLTNRTVGAEETTATLLALAVSGALQLRVETIRSGGWFRSASEVGYARLVDPDRVQAGHEEQLIDTLFPGRRPGTEIALTPQSSMPAAHRAMERTLLAEIRQLGWFLHLPSSRRGPAGGWMVFLVAWLMITMAGPSLLVVADAFTGLGAAVWLRPFLIILVTVVVARMLTRKGQRSALGRAYTDQVEGFREYLSTAEADQLRFEEGEDIYSRYLPWAALFGLTERWTRICEELVAMGRLPQTAPTWYYGRTPFSPLLFQAAFHNVTMNAITPPAPQVSSSGSGFGGGSSFGGGGGFSGGGGGGGGVGSW